MTAAQVLAAHTAMYAKHQLACRRPDKLSATVMPMLVTPGHNSFPSAHAAEAFAVATVLDGLVHSEVGWSHYPSPDRLSKLLFKQAERIAVNRTVAGMHFPIDRWAGAALGEAVGQLILAMAGAERKVDRLAVAEPCGVEPRTYSVPEKSDGHFEGAETSDFKLASFNLHAKKFGLIRGQKFPLKSNPVFEWLWQKASNEFSITG